MLRDLGPRADTEAYFCLLGPGTHLAGATHYASPWQELGYYLLVADAAHSMGALRLGAEDRQAYVDLDRPLGQGWVEWGIWVNDRPHLVILRTKAPGQPVGRGRRWTEFDGYGEARPFASSLVGRDGGRK